MKNARTSIGKVGSIWRYPVKSMIGENLDYSYISERGILGDRSYALIDQKTGKVASAKNPSKWGNLFDFHSSFIDQPQTIENIPPIHITFPDNTQISSDQDDIDHALSNALGQEVKLMRSSLEKPRYEEYWPDIDGLAQREKVTDEIMPSRTFFDLAVIHLLTTSTINHLQKLYPEGRFEIQRFRPNIVIESMYEESDFVENLWIGKKMVIGDEIELKITGPCTRCVMTTLPQGDLPKDLGILRTIARYNHVNVGVYASVERGGTIHIRDLVQLEE